MNTNALVSAILLTYCAASQSAVLRVIPIGHTGGGPGTYMITALSATPDEFATSSSGLAAGQFSLYLYDERGRRTNCDKPEAASVITCGPDWVGSKPTADRTKCNTPADAAASMSQFIGLTYSARTSRPYQWVYGCWARYQLITLPRALPVDFDNPPAACTANTALLTLRGKVGERLKETTDLQIHCDLPANIRLSMPNGGLVSVGGEGEGEVLLTFQTNGSDVLNVSGTDPLVSIDGELTKSPTTAGTYRGSTVLRLDIL